MSGPDARRELIASLGVGLAGCLWGAFWMPMREIGAAGIGGAWATLAFFLPMSLMLLPLAVIRWRRIQASLGALAISGTLVGMAFCLYATGLLLGEVVRVVLLFYLTPVWGTVLAWMVLRTPITTYRMLALAAGLAGLAVILGAETGLPVPRYAGDWMGLMAGLLWAGGTLAIHRRSDQSPTDIVLFFCLCGTASAALTLLLPIPGNAAMPGPAEMRDALVWILVIGLVFTLPTMWIILWAARFLDPGRIGLLLLSEVLFAVVTAALYAGEPFGVREVVGAALIVAAGLVDVLGQRRRAKPAPGPTRG